MPFKVFVFNRIKELFIQHIITIYNKKADI
jgi:hypothetical protein